MKLSTCFFLLIFLALFQQGCERFQTLKEDTAEWNSSQRFVGRLQGTPSERKNAYIVLWTKNSDSSLKIQDITTSKSDGRFAFLLKEDMEYFLGAFQDSNQNTQLDQGELFWFYGNTTPVPIPTQSQTGAISSALKIEQKEYFHASILDALRLDRGTRSLIELSTNQSIEVILGEVTNLDDSRFDATIAEQGLWEPKQFVRDHGIGVYFLQPYTPAKIPLVFVHGASGTPLNWKWVIQHIDTEIYQPWVFYYPSGLRLEESAEILSKILNALKRDHNLQDLGVVAHSMGGLVARRAVQMIIEENETPYISGLVTISTPWNGHAMAKLGVDHAPEAIPSWYDMEPESDFIQNSFSLPLETKHLLIYGDKSKRSILLPKENDGSVSVESMTDDRALQAATESISFSEDHMSILRSKQVLEELERFFSNTKD